MGRHSEMEPLVDRIERSRQARERTKVILMTMAGDWSVKQGCARLGIGRTRFQVLRDRMLDGAVAAVEERPQGRPPKAKGGPTEAELRLRAEIASLDRELARTRMELELARSSVAKAVNRRVLAKAVRR